MKPLFTTQKIKSCCRTLGLHATALAGITLCSCSVSPSSMASDPFLDGATVETIADRSAPVLSVRKPSTTFQTQRPADGTIRQPIQQTSYRESASRAVQTAAQNIPPSSGATFSPAEARDDIGVRAAIQQQRQNPDRQPRCCVPEYADEYLIDGGDRAYPLHREQVGYSGLDTEDTVADFADHKGKRHMLPTNCVAIYSPRFAAVRTVSGSEAGITVDRLATAGDTTRTVGMRTNIAPNYHEQRESTDGVRVRTRASGLGGPAIPEGVDQTTYVSENVELLNVFQDLQFVKGGQMLTGEKARLALGVQNAVIWNRDQFPVATASIDAVHQVTARFKPQELVGVEDKKTPGQLRIVKLADKNVASIGDIVTFTIRYDNMGDRELKELQIIDNLTPRLVYVKDSASSDQDGRLDVTSNGEGSNILTFTLKGPLPGHEGGVLTFKAQIQ